MDDPKRDDQGPMVLAWSLALYAIAVIVYLIRIGSRLYPKYALTAADYAITFSILCKSAAVGFMVAAINHGFGKHSIYVDRVSVGAYTFACFMLGVPSSCFARISIACLLLQFTTSRRWRILIWLTITLQVLLFLLYEIMQLSQCTSVLAARLNIDQSQCLKPQTVWSFTYATISIAMFSDLICATIPIFLVWRLSRSVVERTLVSILLASGLLATGIGIAKVYYMAIFDFSSKDGFYLMVPEFFWSRMEETIIIIAACAPLLKCPVERALRRLGVRMPENRGRVGELNVIKSVSPMGGSGVSSSNQSGSSPAGSRGSRWSEGDEPRREEPDLEMQRGVAAAADDDDNDDRSGRTGRP